MKQNYNMFADSSWAYGSDIVKQKKKSIPA